MDDKLFGGYKLQRFDKDKISKWGGQRKNQKGSFVSDLQDKLKSVGIYDWKIDGDFGGKTQLAVKLFQWNTRNISYRIKGNVIITDSSPFLGSISGIVDDRTQKEIKRWLDNKFHATGDLIRFKASKLSNIDLSDDFRKINHPNVNKGEFVISSALLTYLKFANKKASELSLKIVLNQTMRVNGVKVADAVVVPAKKSQHLIGHAIDCNIVDGTNWNSSKIFLKGDETDKARKFIAAIKGKGMRWGGDFANVDTPHFDKQILTSTLDYDYKYYFNQRMMSDKQNILLSNG